MSPASEAIISPTGTYTISSTSKSDEKVVRSWGFTHVFTWRDGPNAYYSPHTHSGLTTHLIRKGEMKVRYPDDEVQDVGTFGVGARVDVPAGKRHEVWMGESGCEYVIGE